MSGKNPSNAKAAKDGAAKDFSASPAPDATEDPVPACEKKHWMAVRVVDERGKPVKDVKVKLKLSDGSTSNITTDKNGKFKTPKNLPPGNCTIALPDVFDAEWKEA